MQIRLKKVLMACILLIWFAPIVQQLYPLVELKKLEGWVTYAPDDSISVQKWFDGTYTPNKENYIKEAFGFRNFFVRVKNQLFFSALNVPAAKGVVIGKDGMLYEEKYIESYVGADFIGKDALRTNLKKLKFVSDTLKKLNVDLIVLLAPGKATYYPEYIPDMYFKNGDTVNTNYKWAVKIAKEEGLNFIDYNALFKSLKTSTKFPLYPKGGIHWSFYGAHYAFDTLTKYIESVKHKSLKHFTYNKITWSDNLREQDGDIAGALNILFEPKHFKMPYPTIEYVDTANKYKPNVITISDSYWTNIYTSWLPKNIFNAPEYWYFYSQNWDSPGAEDPLLYNLKEKIESNDVILVMATEPHIANLGFGFIEDAYNLYTQGEEANKNREATLKLYRAKRLIKTDKKLMFEIGEKAKQRHITCEAMLDIQAATWFTVNGEQKKADGDAVVNSLKNYIKNNPELMKEINKRVELEKMPIGKVIFEEAKNIFNTKDVLTIKAANGKFLCADRHKENNIIADRSTGGAWETFSLLKLKNNTCIMFSSENKFLSTELDRETEMTATRDAIGAWEIFTLVDCGDGFIALKAANGKYISLNEKNSQLYATGNSIGKNEKFALIKAN